jgi:hypothetical protein
MEFMRDSILDRMDEEHDLKFSGMRASPYKWVRVLCSFAVIFPDIRDLWQRWWKKETKGRAICVLQYISCLLYEADSNPIFSPWTPAGRGGPPRAISLALAECFNHELLDEFHRRSHIRRLDHSHRHAFRRQE